MSEWWGEIDDAVLDCLRDNGAMAPHDIGRRLGMSEHAVTSVLSMLAQERKVKICLVECDPALVVRRHHAA